MNFKKAPHLFGLSLLLLAGCSQNYSLWGPFEPSAEQEVSCGQNCVAEPVAVIVPSNEQANNGEFVNYRQTAADYRTFGERTPQDQRIVTGGPGSNISAAIPPTIDEEVADYENAVDAAFSESESNEFDGNSSGDDAVEDWLAEEGNTLKGLLSEWSERAGWRLVWNSNRNYTLAAGAMFRGRFADVASALIRNFARARPAPLATFYKGNRVLVVETMEDENAYN